MVSAGSILVFLNSVMVHFRNIFPSVLALFSLALYSDVCCQNLVTNSLTTFRTGEASLSTPYIYQPIHPDCHLSDIWYNIEIVEVLIAQIADYMKLWNDNCDKQLCTLDFKIFQ